MAPERPASQPRVLRPPGPLPIPGGPDPQGHLGRALSRARSLQPVAGHGRHVDVEVDAVEEPAGTRRR